MGPTVTIGFLWIAFEEKCQIGHLGETSDASKVSPSCTLCPEAKNTPESSLSFLSLRWEEPKSRLRRRRGRGQRGKDGTKDTHPSERLPRLAASEMNPIPDPSRMRRHPVKDCFRPALRASPRELESFGELPRRESFFRSELSKTLPRKSSLLAAGTNERRVLARLRHCCLSDF